AVMVQAGTIDLGKGEKDSAFDDMVYVECPKCDKIMDQRLIEEPNRIRFELCPTCNATFLDAGELREYISPRFIEDFKSLLPE
ncbi:MAG: zf-TFIIB domain-containing protein, partial [Pseudomonadales bacterium]|nr:zf-TFIIB domain-containing protein [Pseudomonadales bacterium]